MSPLSANHPKQRVSISPTVNLCGLLRLGNQQIDERQKRLLGKGILLASNVTIYPSDSSFKEFVEAILAGNFNS